MGGSDQKQLGPEKGWDMTINEGGSLFGPRLAVGGKLKDTNGITRCKRVAVRRFRE